jgi:hypothetical protein
MNLFGDFGNMRFTIDIQGSVLGDLLKLTGSRKRSPAVAYAVEDYVRRQKMRQLGHLIREGAFADAFDPDYDPDFPHRAGLAPGQSYPPLSKGYAALVLAEESPEYGGEVKATPNKNKPAAKRKNGPR